MQRPRSSPSQLDYAPPTKTSRRKWILRGVVVVLAFVAVVMSWRWGSRAFDLVRIRRLYAHCAAGVIPPDTVIFSEDYSRPGHPATHYLVNDWLELNHSITGTAINSSGTALAHELHTPSGQRRLVGVDVVQWVDGIVHLRANVFTPAPPFRYPKPTTARQGSVDLPETVGILKIYAAQIDPSDTSHFTIRVMLANQTHIIDGWLKDDDTVLLESRPTP